MALSTSNNRINFMKEVKSKGHALSSEIVKYASRNEPYHPQIVDLATEIALTSNMIEFLVETITHDSAAQSGTEENTLWALCEGVRAIFNRVENAMEIVMDKDESDEWDNADGTLVDVGCRPSVMPDGTKAVMHEIGGSREVADLHSRLENIREIFVYIIDAIKYLSLKRAEKENQLDSKQSNELKKLAVKAPRFASELRFRKFSILELVGKVLGGADIAKKGDAATPGRIDLDERLIIQDDDARSIASIDSLASENYFKTDVLYEYWVLQKIEGENISRRSWGFFGFIFREYTDDTAFHVEGKAKTQEELKAIDELAKSDAAKLERKVSIKNTIASMPHRLQTEILYLLEDRERISSNLRFIRDWNVVDVQPLEPKVATPATSWNSWWKGRPGTTKWACIIKGETVSEDAKLSERMRIPNRFDDPYRKFPGEDGQRAFTAQETFRGSAKL
ncbi:hypothetical protein G7Y89_g3249 [Cudoniella acicularis]|uniref:Uncharacterized protein n=1 Tax=Cudoniella acicularis TaxID=354080 RepID=A0A8H4RTL9_9HELO|nr:hypothetical protein G7Y89_g3249 [Cudoniella acicularis]